MVRLPVGAEPLDAHFSPSIGIDSDDNVHVFGGAHVTQPFYMKTEHAGQLNSLSTIDAPFPPGEDRISYPSCVMSGDGRLFLIYRIGVPARSSWRLMAWQGEDKCWSSESRPLVSGMGEGTWAAGPYLNTPIREHGGYFGVFLVWRSEAISGSKQRVSNIGVDYFETKLDGPLIRTRDGRALPTPVTPAVSERVIAVGWNSQLSNQSGATRLPDGRPFGTALWSAPGQFRQIHVFWPTKAGKWVSRVITHFKSNELMLGRGTLHLPHSRPVCSSLPNGSVLVMYRSAEAGGRLLGQLLRPPDFKSHPDEKYILWDSELGYYEPVIDVARAEASGIVSAFVQKCDGAADNYGGIRPTSAEAFLVDWKFS